MAEYYQVYKVINNNDIYFTGDNFLEDYIKVLDCCYKAYEKMHHNLELKREVNFYDLVGYILLDA